MRILIYVLIAIAIFIIFIAIVEKPMDDSGDEFNPNIFPFEIKDPKEWGKSKKDDETHKKD